MGKGILASAVVAFLAACGGDDDAGPLSPAQAESLCEDYCGTCEQDDDDCQADCEEEASNPCLNGDAFRTIVDCLDEATCDLDDFGDCADLVMPAAAHERWAEDCRGKLADCGAPSDAIAEVCDLDAIKYYSADWTDDARTCFEEDCAAIEACLEAAADPC